MSHAPSLYLPLCHLHDLKPKSALLPITNLYSIKTQVHHPCSRTFAATIRCKTGKNPEL